MRRYICVALPRRGGNPFCGYRPGTKPSCFGRAPTRPWDGCRSRVRIKFSFGENFQKGSSMGEKYERDRYTGIKRGYSQVENHYRLDG